MSEYYFFNEIKEIKERDRWFRDNFSEIVRLEHTAPVTFSIDWITYTIRYDEEKKRIYTIKLYGKENNIRPYHETVRKKIEKFLNALKNKK